MQPSSVGRFGRCFPTSRPRSTLFLQVFARPSRRPARARYSCASVHAGCRKLTDNARHLCPFPSASLIPRAGGCACSRCACEGVISRHVSCSVDRSSSSWYLHGSSIDSCVRPNTAEPEPKAHTTPPRTRACTREGVLSGLATHEPLLTSHLRRCMQRSPSRTHMTAVRLVSPPLCRRNVSTEHPSS